MGSLFKFFGLDRIATLGRLIKNHGGIIGAYKELYITDDVKEGTLIGEDKYGNKYYQNDKYFYGRNRWVIYNKKHHLEYDGSMIPAEWFGWMHYKTDIPPTVKPPVKHRWMTDHTPNYSGTDKAYVPYSTTKPKIHSWKPGQPKERLEA